MPHRAQQHDPPPLPILRQFPNPYHLLVTTFPPSSPQAPPLAHPVILATHFIATSFIGSDKTYTATPLRPYNPESRPRLAPEKLRPFDEKRAEQTQSTWFYDQSATQTLAHAIVDRSCFQPVEPDFVDQLPAV